MSYTELTPGLVWIFKNEILTQSKHVVLSLDEMSAYLNGQAGDVKQDYFWYHMNAALSAMATIGNILWPVQDRKVPGDDPKRMSSQARGRLLRGALGIGDESVLALHGVRNGLAHFDERVDAWFATSKNKNYVASSIADTNAIGGDGIAKGDVARHFDKSTNIVSVFGVSFDLQAAVREVDGLIALLGEDGFYYRGPAR